MCLLGPTLSVDQYAKKVDLAAISEGRQPKNTLLAWRVWKVEKLFPSVTLRSQSQTAVWTPGKPTDGRVEEKGDAGIHAYKTVKQMLDGGYTSVAKDDYKQESVIVGQVLLWGAVAVHVNGFRAEHGYPFLIYANGPELQERIAANYGCRAARSFIPRLLKEAA